MGDDEFGPRTTTTMKHSQHSAPNRRLSLIATTSGLACGVLCATSFNLGLAQEPKPIQPQLRDVVEAERSPQDEMLELFHAVERRMQDMGSYLLDASAGDTSDRCRQTPAAGRRRDRGSALGNPRRRQSRAGGHRSHS